MKIVRAVPSALGSALLSAVLLTGLSVPTPASAGNGPPAEPSLFIDAVLPHPHVDPAEPFEEDLPGLAEPRAAAMWNWSGDGPVSIQAVFETFNANPRRIDSVEVFVNGAPVPDVELIALPNGSAGFGAPVTDGWIDPNGTEVVNQAATYKIAFVVPYRLPAEALKVHLEILVRAGFADGTVVQAAKHVTLLNNARLEAVLTDIDVRLVNLSLGLAFVCSALNDTIGAVNTAGNGINTALQALRFSDITVDIPEVDLGDPCPGALDCPIEFDIPSFTIPNPLQNAYGPDVVPDIGTVDCSF